MALIDFWKESYEGVHFKEVFNLTLYTACAIAYARYTFRQTGWSYFWHSMLVFQLMNLAFFWAQVFCIGLFYEVRIHVLAAGFDQLDAYNLGSMISLLASLFYHILLWYSVFNLQTDVMEARAYQPNGLEVVVRVPVYAWTTFFKTSLYVAVQMIGNIMITLVYLRGSLASMTPEQPRVSA